MNDTIKLKEEMNSRAPATIFCPEFPLRITTIRGTKAAAATGRSHGCQFPLAVDKSRSTERHNPPPSISQSSEYVGYGGFLFIVLAA
jgi:hypothetical protein